MEADIHKLDAFFNPHSVAIVGATKKIYKAGHVIFKNFAINKQHGVFKGALYPVNPNEDSILGYKCYSSISQISGPIDLIIIIVPAKAVLKIIQDAADKKVKAAIIISAGFKEIGNNELEEKIVHIAKKGGVRILGPNCLGIYYAKTGIDSLFLPETKILTSGEEVVATPRPMRGDIAMITQSGAFGVAALDFLTGRQMGISKFISFGNRADVSESEILNYLLHDQETKLIISYFEDIKNGREFLEMAKKVTMKKPIIVIKAGRSNAGARAAASHTGAIAGLDKIYEAAFRQSGVIRAKDMEEFFDMAKALDLQPPAKGKNVAILTGAGGPGVMAVDECELLGLEIPTLSTKTRKIFENLKKDGTIVKFAATDNPVDLTGSVTDKMYEISAELLFQDSKIDGLIFLGLHHMPGLREEFINGVAKIASKYPKPIVMCDIGETEMALYTRSRFDRLCIPAYSSPEDAVRAMKSLITYGLFLQKNGCMNEYLEAHKKKKCEDQPL
ncbi:MAG: CoA-binding protein [Crenarchaeota archaeon]|nr:CoA-binding protein [Thermoproteota archaeon]